MLPLCFCFFFFNDTATTEIYTLSLHDALPICCDGSPAATRRTSCRAGSRECLSPRPRPRPDHDRAALVADPDRKSTRLNSSHLVISYAVFCLKKKKKQNY